LPEDRLSDMLKDMTVTLDMPKEIEAQFTAAAKARGVEDADDLRTALERLGDPQAGITSNQLRKNLGLDG
jgi:hypothetical protein